MTPVALLAQLISSALLTRAAHRADSARAWSRVEAMVRRTVRPGVAA